MFSEMFVNSGLTDSLLWIRIRAWAKSGATDIYAHVGFGSAWDNLYDYRMNKTDTGFEVTVPVKSADTINICFKDCAGNWDNNSGMNYSFDISQ
mgnify:CR=1 FL=1